MAGYSPKPMPRATESSTDIFMTDQGSTRETVSLTRRPAAAALAAPLALVAGAGADGAEARAAGRA